MGKNPQAIRAQLDRIRCSPTFKSSERLGPVLGFLVEETLAGRTRGIDHYSVGVKGLGYPKDFAPATNPAIHILLRRTRRALRGYYADSGIEDPIRIDIPDGSSTPTFSPNV